MSSTHTAEEIITAAQNHIATLVSRKWPEIVRILEKEGEIAISAKIAVTAREATPGEHADKDNRVKTTVSFAEKFSDSTETALGESDQTELSFEERETSQGESTPEGRSHAGCPELPTGFVFVDDGEPEDADDLIYTADGEWHSLAQNPMVLYTFRARPVGANRAPTPEGAGVTNLGDALKAAASAADLPVVPIKLDSGYPAAKSRGQFRKAARKAGWGEAAIDLIDGECAKAAAGVEDDIEAGDRVRQLLAPHVLGINESK